MSGGGGGGGVSYSIHEYSKFEWDIYMQACMYVLKEKEIHF